MHVQYDLFEVTPSEMDLLRAEITEARRLCENVRRGLFARFNELSKMYVKQQQEIDILRSMLVKEYK